MDINNLPSHLASVLRAYEATGRSVSVRRNRSGSFRVSLNGFPETDMRRAIAKCEDTMTRERSWPHQGHEDVCGGCGCHND